MCIRDRRDGDKLPEPIFTPAAKAPLGEHDENITYAQLVDLHLSLIHI